MKTCHRDRSEPDMTTAAAAAPAGIGGVEGAVEAGLRMVHRLALFGADGEDGAEERRLLRVGGGHFWLLQGGFGGEFVEVEKQMMTWLKGDGSALFSQDKGA